MSLLAISLRQTQQLPLYFHQMLTFRHFLQYVSLPAVTAGAVALTAGCGTPATRSTWVREVSTYKVTDSSSERSQMIGFLKRNNISHVYLYADRFHRRNAVINERKKLANLVRSLRSQEITVYAQLGSRSLEPERYLYPKNKSRAALMVQRVLAYNRSQPEGSRFQGINITIEPHRDKQWRSRKEWFCKAYLQLASDYMKMKSPEDIEFPIGATIPHWYDSFKVNWNGKRAYFSRHIQDLYDYVTITEVGDKAEGRGGMIQLTKSEAEYADKIDKSIWLSVETRKTNKPDISFYEEGPPHLKRALETSELELSGYGSLQGFVFNDYRAYKRFITGADLMDALK
jgi:hypothetical protein